MNNALRNYSYAIGLAGLIALLLIGMPWANRRTSPTSSASIGRRQ